MTDTDKLKRLAEGLRPHIGKQVFISIDAEEAATILALIAENERLKVEKRNMQAVFNDTVGECDKLSTERDEAVALLLECLNQPMEPWGKVAAFLARIEAWE